VIEDELRCQRTGALELAKGYRAHAVSVGGTRRANGQRLYVVDRLVEKDERDVGALERVGGRYDQRATSGTLDGGRDVIAHEDADRLSGRGPRDLGAFCRAIDRPRENGHAVTRSDDHVRCDEGTGAQALAGEV
jgi:hypothetical protein